MALLSFYNQQSWELPHESRMRIAVGADHAGFELKDALAEHLRSQGHDVLDCGTGSAESVDYPGYGAAVGRSVVCGDADTGVAVCGSGIGIAIAANKVAGVRAATVHDVTAARLARAHNDANVVCFGARLIGAGTALDALDAWLSTPFDSGERHERRVAQLDGL